MVRFLNDLTGIETKSSGDSEFFEKIPIFALRSGPGHRLYRATSP